MAKHTDFGQFGEEVAVDFLLKKGYEIRARNYRYLKAEIDIIAYKDNELAIVEVKSRASGFMEDISDVINPKKIKLLTLAADNYVQEEALDIEVRFDIITVIGNRDFFEINHVENAFYHF